MSTKVTAFAILNKNLEIVTTLKTKASEWGPILVYATEAEAQEEFVSAGDPNHLVVKEVDIILNDEDANAFALCASGRIGKCTGDRKSFPLMVYTKKAQADTIRYWQQVFTVVPVLIEVAPIRITVEFEIAHNHDALQDIETHQDIVGVDKILNEALCRTIYEDNATTREWLDTNIIDIK